MRLISTFARIGMVGFLGLLLAVLMDPANWVAVSAAAALSPGVFRGASQVVMVPASTTEVKRND